MTVGDASKLINAQNVKFTFGGSGEVLSLYDISYIDESVLDRRNTRDGAVDTPSFSLIEIIASANIDEDLYIALRALRQLTTRGALPTAAFTIVATAISSSTDDFTISGTFTLRRMESKAAESGRYEVTMTMRLKGSDTKS